MGRVKLSVAGGKLTGPVVLHLDRAVAHDLLQALTQALEPHSTNVGKLKKGALKGRPPKGMSLKAKSVRGKRSKGKSPKGNRPKGKPSKKSR
jgi:hypothetical protein